MGPSGVQKNLKKSLSGFKKFNKRDLNLTKPMEKLMIKNVLNKFGFARIARRRVPLRPLLLRRLSE
ncbi:MAG: hypothetical protein DME91_05830 [Verrucomicrobia bacterium]|nr:MAG: hypothetical protein DME91_05830 [Verrucomicrobiota bacterium]